MSDVGFGCTVVFGTSGFTASLDSIDLPGWVRESIDTSHMTTTNGQKTFMPSDMSDAGELGMEVHFNPNTTPPLAQTDLAETITITWPLPAGGSTAGTWAASGFVTSYSASAEKEGLMTASVTCKLSGGITIVASS